MLKVLKQDGIASITEVIVSSIFFVVVGIGIFTTISMLQPQNDSAIKKIEAIYTGKSVLAELRRNLTALNWNQVGGNYVAGTQHSITRGDYTINFITQDIVGSAARQIFVNISYPDN